MKILNHDFQKIHNYSIRFSRSYHTFIKIELFKNYQFALFIIFFNEYLDFKMFAINFIVCFSAEKADA